MNVGWRVPAAVAIGGAIGAGGRWLAGVPFDVVVGTFPTATLLVNVVGCLLIGIAAGRVHRDSLAWAFLVTGVLGGFTTMSAFARELNDLVEADRNGLMVLYLAATLVGGVAALLAAERGVGDVAAMTPVLFVVAAGAGALGRFAIAQVVCSWQALLVANTVGSGLLGLVIASDLDPRWVTVLGVGFCGALTTYSSFAWELRREGWRFTGWYAPLTIACATGAASLGAGY